MEGKGFELIGFINKRLRRPEGPKRHRLQNLVPKPGLNLISLGTSYGGWTFQDDVSLQNAVVISAGLGEDASFDVAFAKKYSAKIILVDPTPRAVSYYEAMKLRFGYSAECAFVEGGKQPIEAYDLVGLSESDLVFEPTALWTENTRLKFFQPEDPNHVSHSIVNFQNDYRKDTAAIEVEAVTLQTLLQRHGLEGQRIALLKLDIEGAEVEVLEQLAAQGIFPRQICVEFDELNRPGDKAFERVDRADAALRSSGYECVYGNGGTDYLYLKL